MKNNRYNLTVFSIISICFILLIMGLTLYLGYDSKKQDRGTFGDMFGAANALFTGLSFVGLLVTILLQRQDFNSQKADDKIQNFESTFFNLLNYHRETINGLEKDYQRRKTTGIKIETQDYSKKGVQLMRRFYEQYAEGLQGDKKFDKERYRKLYKLNWDVLGHYFRGVQSLLDFIDSLHLNTYDEFFYKKRYFDIFKSQLSEYETTMIFYHFLFIENKRYKMLAEEYGFFEFVNDELVTDDKDFYDENAFM